MRKVLQDPIAVREKTDGVWPWGFEAPSYDNRTSFSIPAGNYYGTGHRTPEGRFDARSMKEGPIPQEADCFEPKEIFRGEDKKG